MRMILSLFGFSSFKGSCFGLRWFTPASEVSLCGHATLASAAVLFNKISNMIFFYEPITEQIASFFFFFLNPHSLWWIKVTGIKTLQSPIHAIQDAETDTASRNSGLSDYVPGLLESSGHCSLECHFVLNRSCLVSDQHRRGACKT